MTTQVLCFPFDLFGGGGAGAGVTLLAEALRELLADNRRETVPTRAQAYAGQLRLREIDFATLADYTDWRRRGRDAFRRASARDDRIVWLSGNHLGVLPVYDELAGRDDVLIVQLDAHLDIHHFADCRPEPSHGNFLLHVEGSLPPVVNVGHRDLLLPADHVASTYRRTFPATEIATDSASVLGSLHELTQSAKRVYLDIDCDVLDPAFFPAVPEPIPFGLSPQQMLAAIDAIWSPRVAGVFVSEYDPGRDQADRCLATLVWLLEHLFLRWHDVA